MATNWLLDTFPDIILGWLMARADLLGALVCAATNMLGSLDPRKAGRGSRYILCSLILVAGGEVFMNVSA
jgi:hypothetical protein